MEHLKHRIWQVVDSRGAGGIESHVLELASGLHLKGWPVTVVFLSDYGPHPLKNALDIGNVPWLCLNGSPLSFWKALSTQDPELLHTHGYKAGVLGRLLGRMKNKKIVSTFHAGEKSQGRLALYTWLDRKTASLSSPIAVSQKIAKTLPKQTRQINNFVSPQVAAPSPFSRRIAFVGRLSDEKGPDIFCKIAQALPSLQFNIYGDGPMYASLKRQYGTFVKFHGHVEMSAHWRNIDLLCMPSRFEGLPMAALEAMARYIPVLSSNVGELPALIQHEENGWLAETGKINDFTSIITKWASLEIQTRLDIGEAANETVTTSYSPSAILPQIEEIYLKALSG